MDDRLALMAAIVANPAEDTPRLAFADWLQEHGDEHDRARAEHIRLQIEYDPMTFGSPAMKKLQRLTLSIQKKHAKHWLGPLAPIVNRRGWVRVDRPGLFERGLIDWPSSSPDQFLTKSHQKLMREWFPLVGVNKLELNGPTTRYAEIAASPVLAWVPAFEWDECNIADAGLGTLVKSPHFTRLSSFSLAHTRLTDRGLTKFADTATMPNLRRFRLWAGTDGKCTAAGLLAVVGSARFPKLCELDCFLPDDLDVAELVNDRRMKKLKLLALGNCDLAAAVRSTHLGGLEELSGYEVSFTDEDAVALLANPALANLKRFELILRDDPLTPAVKKKLRARFGDGFTADEL